MLCSNGFHGAKKHKCGRHRHRPSTNDASHRNTILIRWTLGAFPLHSATSCGPPPLTPGMCEFYFQMDQPLHLSQPWCYFSCCGCVYLLVFIERNIFSTALRDSFMDCQINSRNQHKSPRSSISLLAFNFIWIISFRHFRLGMNVLIYVWSQVDLDGWSVCYEWPFTQDRSKNVKKCLAARGAGSEGWQPVYRIAI